MKHFQFGFAAETMIIDAISKNINIVQIINEQNKELNRLCALCLALKS